MPSNRAYNDLDVVQPTRYKAPPEPWELPKFKPFLIGGYHQFIYLSTGDDLAILIGWIIIDTVGRILTG